MPRWPRERRRDDDRFARAVDDGEGEGFGDELRVVGALRRLGASAGMDDATRARLAERTLPPDPAADGAAGTTSRARRRRLTPALVAAAAVLVALTGLGLLFSEDAVPGDLLYGLKRAREEALLQLTVDDESRALRQLDYAAERVDEWSRLSGSPGSPADYAADYGTALAAFTEDTRGGVAQLTALATSSDGHQLTMLRTWAREQAARLVALGPRLPEDGEAPEALLSRVEQRAKALGERLGCYAVTTGEFDELGAIPAMGACDRSSPEDTAPPDGEGVPVPPEPDSSVPDERTVARDVTNTIGPAAPEPAVPSSRPSAPPRSAAPSAVPAPIPAVRHPRLPDSTPPPPAAVSVPPLLPGLPEVTIG